MTETSSNTKKLEKALTAMTERAQIAETDLAVSEAENDDMVKQLEESKGLYMILDKKYHLAKAKIKELEEKWVYSIKAPRISRQYCALFMNGGQKSDIRSFTQSHTNLLLVLNHMEEPLLSKRGISQFFDPFTPKLIIQILLTIQEQMYEWCSENS